MRSTSIITAKIKNYLLSNLPQKAGDYEARAKELRQKGYKITADTVRHYYRRAGKTLNKVHLSQGGDEEMNKVKLFDYNKLSNSLLDLVKQERPEIHLPQMRKHKNSKLTEQAVLHLSDIHYGKMNYFFDTNLNKRILTYSPNIFVQEMNRMIDGITTINDLLLGGYNLEVLNILATGDLVDNELIYRGQHKFVEEGVISQVLSITSYLKQMIIEMLKLFPKVRMVIVGGNHSRLTSIPEADWDYNNFDYLIGKVLQIIFAGEKRVEMVVPDSWYYVDSIYRWKYLMHHGNTVFSWMSMPYYGIVRQSKARRLEMPYDIELIGHFHPSQILQIPTSSHSLTIVDGCWIEKDTLSWKKYATLSTAKQLYFGVSTKRPMTWAFPLDLTTNNNQ